MSGGVLVSPPSDREMMEAINEDVRRSHASRVGDALGVSKVRCYDDDDDDTHPPWASAVLFPSISTYHHAPFAVGDLQSLLSTPRSGRPRPQSSAFFFSTSLASSATASTRARSPNTTPAPPPSAADKRLLMSILAPSAARRRTSASTVDCSQRDSTFSLSRS